MILLIDNYDSFTYNLYQEMGSLYSDITVVRNDVITTEEIAQLHPQALVISPGPGYPDSAGVSLEAIRRFSGRLPILGVCLGHQAIAQAFGGSIVRAKELMHGKASAITLDTASPLFAGLPNQIPVARYHSLIADEASLPPCLRITARDSIDQIMAIAHESHPTYGVQFHPESILTDSGMQILRNFLTRIVHVPISDSKYQRIAAVYAAEMEATYDA